MASAGKSYPAREKEQKRTLEHFTHPHILTRDASDQSSDQTNDFLCDACNTLGSGARYRCKQCDFDIHENCADCPEYLNTYIHPNHRLELMWEGSGIRKDFDQLRPCDVCGDQVKGLFYTCSSGAEKRYDNVHHVIDKYHPLKFQSAPVIADSLCAICRDVVLPSSWSYRCDPCGVNIHLECVTLPYDNHHHSGTTTHTSRSPQDPQAQMHQRKRPAQPPPGSPPPPYNNYCPPPYNYYPYPPPPPNYYYYYPQPYWYPPMPPPPYHHHHPPFAPPKKTSTHGSKMKRSASVLGRIAVSLLLSAALGGAVSIG
ncbi:hypothetical protein MKW98_020988 [Papaver atlanticum]|uniref:DC1 domain-containing protein n=1 Tax=Papaver atlanticum TaxID=357466 RepID=A0AAD4SLR3_9MAGN|nr:hypothetical protein MKW98_020988 [Papaver atlanticum]